MPSLNKVMLMGNLTRDPQLKYLPSNTAVVDIGLAVNRRWRSQEGEQRDETTFVDCSAFGRTAEVINQYLKKGRPIFIEGRLRLEQWQDKQSGQNRSKLTVIIENFQFIDSRGGGEGGDAGGPPPSQSSAPQSTPAAQSAPAGNEPFQPVDEGDIPF